MEQKTKLNAEEGRQEMVITREFDLPLELLFKAYEDPELLGQWMGTKVVKLENKQHGSWQFETSDPSGNVVFQAHGVIHEFVPNQGFARTFEMVGVSFGIQLEFFKFEKINEERSRLTMHIVFKSVAHRDQMLRIPFAQGLNMAHNRLQEIVNKLK